MIALAALLSTTGAPAATPLDAERAFDAAAARDGQWTALRAFAEADAITLPGPEPISALTRLPDPPARLRWQPQASFVSCDGSMAVDTGRWQQPGGIPGWFTTVWHRQPDGGWKYRILLADTLHKAPPPAGPPLVHRAACPAHRVPIVRREYLAGPSGDGGSDDGSLQFHWHGLAGTTTFAVTLWNGTRLQTVHSDRIVGVP